jgi:hypothetical protein
VESVLAQLTPEVSRQISRKLGVDQQTVQRAVMIALPLLVAALARNAANQRGAESLSSALARDHDGSILDDVPGAVRGYEDQPGEGILKHVLGDRRGEAGNVLTQVSGADGAAMLQILAPIVMGVLGNMQRQQQLDPGGLASTLGQEREELAQAGGRLPEMPAGPAAGPATPAPQASDAIADLLAQFLR